MTRLIKTATLLLAGVLTAAAFTACRGSDESEPIVRPPLKLISPETLYEKMLEDDYYQIHALYEITTAESGDRSVDYTMTRDGSALKFRYKEETAENGEYQEITYADLDAERYIYRDILFDWVYDAPSEEYDNGSLEGYLYNILPMDPEFMLEDRNYLDLAEGGTVYEIDKEAFLEFMDEEEHPDLPVTLTVQVDGQSYVIETDYQLSDGSAVDSTVRVTFDEISVEIPQAKLSVVYEDESDLPTFNYYPEYMLDDLIGNKNSVTANGLIAADSIRTDSITTYENEGAEHLFDGVDTEQEWYYNEDGSLKDGGDPLLMTGGGPGKVCGDSGDDFAYFFFSTTEPVEVKAYVLTMANDAKKYARNPVYWVLLGSNDEAAADCTDFYDADWVTLDAVLNQATNELYNFDQIGYKIDADRLEAYKHYCFIAIGNYPQLQLAELELYYTE